MTTFRAGPCLSASVAILIEACASSPSPTVDAPTGYGESKTTAIEVCQPAGERAYLARLACPDGVRPTFRRTGNAGFRNNQPNGGSGPDAIANMERFDTPPPGQSDNHIVDLYQVACGPSNRTLYLDMYHCRQAPPDRAPAGFALRPGPP